MPVSSVCEAFLFVFFFGIIKMIHFATLFSISRIYTGKNILDVCLFWHEEIN